MFDNRSKYGQNAGPQWIKIPISKQSNNFFTISDVIGGLQFPHVAGYHASVVVKNVLFRLPAKADNRSVPWVTYTSSEWVQVCLNKGDARKKYGETIKV